MELPAKYLVAMVLGMIVLLALTFWLTQSPRSLVKLDLQKSFERGCYILSQNGCNFDIVVDGMEFKEIIKKLGYSEEAVREYCCEIGGGIGDIGIPEIPGEEENEERQSEEVAVCGNGKCESGETQDTCCMDCGCPQGYTCINNRCEIINKFEEAGTEFCLDAHPEDFTSEEHINKAIEALTEFKAKYIRFDLNWKDVEPQRDQDDENNWNNYRKLIQKFTSKGFKVILILGVKARAPEWAKNLKETNINEFWEELEEHAREVGERFGDLVDYYQLSNEENAVTHEWFSADEEPEAYYRMNKGLREGDKNGKVITIVNPFGSGEWNDVKQIFQNSKVKDSVDMIAPDPYPGVWEPLASPTQGIENICKDLNNPAHPFYGKKGGIMETGCCGVGGDQAAWIKDKIPKMIEAVKKCNENNNNKIEIFCYYSLFSGDMNFGLINKDTLEKTPAYYALKSVVVD